MSKKAIKVKITLKAGEARPGPPVATSLGPKGVSLMEFCKSFNERSIASVGGIISALKEQFPDLKMDEPAPIKALVHVYENKKFDLELKSIPVAHFLKLFAGVSKGSSLSKREPFKGSITRKHCEAIAKVSLGHMNTDNLQGATKMVIGTAASMNIQVIEG